MEERSSRTVLIRAKIASMAHRFGNAKKLLDEIENWGSLADDANRLSASIDQACGANLDALLETRRKMAAESGRLEDLVPLAALHADLRDFDQAHRIYKRALSEYSGTSPFAVAFVCFQLGALWGELVSEPQPVRAERWYQQAIEYLPCYVKARVHVAEVYLGSGHATEAEALLLAAIHSGDPEIHWRLADVLAKMGRFADAAAHMETARSGFEVLLEKHLLAFADHGAEFYSGSGNDVRRAFELSNVNLVNRPTLRAFEQAYKAAVAAGESEQSTKILTAAKNRWGAANAFRFSQFHHPQVDKLGLGGATA
jgi:tetratricopeptide (TPR) repeat protein